MDRTQIRSPFMQGCDPDKIRKENERIKKLEARRKSSQLKIKFIKECAILFKKRRKIKYGKRFAMEFSKNR